MNELNTELIDEVSDRINHRYMELYWLEEKICLMGRAKSKIQKIFCGNIFDYEKIIECFEKLKIIKCYKK